MSTAIVIAEALSLPFVFGWCWDGIRQHVIAKEYDRAKCWRWDALDNEWVPDNSHVVTGR